VALTLPADAGEPLSKNLIASAEVKHHEFPALTRQVSLRNTGTNTLWISLDRGESWFDVACGTSWDDRAVVRELWYCTQVGRTRFVVIGLALMDMDSDQTSHEEDEDLPRRQASRRSPRRQKRGWFPSRQGRR
jgi:hypothetical protein